MRSYVVWSACLSVALFVCLSLVILCFVIVYLLIFVFICFSGSPPPLPAAVLYMVLLLFNPHLCCLAQLAK